MITNFREEKKTQIESGLTEASFRNTIWYRYNSASSYTPHNYRKERNQNNEVVLLFLELQVCPFLNLSVSINK